MKIVVVTQYFWPENFRINDLVSELKNRGHSVTVLTGIPNYPLGRVYQSYQNNKSEFKNYGGVDIKRVPLFPRGKGSIGLLLNYMSFAVCASLLGPIKLIGIKPDVIFVYEPSPVTVGLPAILIGKVKNAPVVFWALDLWPDTLEALGIVRSNIMLKWVGKLVRLIYDNCALVLGQSKGFMSNIANYCSDNKKIRYFPSWSEDIFDASINEPAPELELNKNVFNILFAGNIGEAQDFPTVLDTAELLKNTSNVRWIIIGNGRMSKWLEIEVKRRNLGAEVVILGSFPIERMPSFFAHADALLVSLKNDPVFSLTVPAKVQTYLMSGIPILGMLNGEGAKIIKETKSGFVCAAGDAYGLESAVKNMLEMNKDELNIMGQNGKAYAEKEFNRAQLISRLEHLMGEAISVHKQRKSK